MSDPTVALKAAVGRLTRDAEFLQNLFLLNYRDENNRTKLQGGYELQGAQITNNLRTLIGKTPRLKPALDKPNSAYNQFISTWNNGTGDLTISFNRITEFNNLLQAAQPALNTLIVQPGPGSGPWTPGTLGKTPAEIQIFTTLRSQTGELFKVYLACVATHTAAAAQEIKELVNAIGKLLIDPRLGRQAQTALTTAKPEWDKFTRQYNNGKAINQASWSQLSHFQAVLDVDVARYLSS
jgi:hypothetical protein